MKTIRWIDAIFQDGRLRCISFATPANGEPKTWDTPIGELLTYLKSDTLRVYLGTYKDYSYSDRGRKKQVTLASGTPRTKNNDERFGKAIFVGPAEEALELFLAHARMLEVV